MFRSRIASLQRHQLVNKRFKSDIPPPHADAGDVVTESNTLARCDGSRRLTNVDFASPMWRNTLAAGVLTYALYKFDEAYASSNDGKGYFAALIDYYRPKDGLWESRNIHHFDLGKEAAESRVLLQSAQKPSIRQLRYPAALDHGSPWNTRVDHMVDNSQVKVRTRNEVASAGVEDSVQ